MTKNEQNKKFYTIFNQLLEENGLTPYKLAKNTGMSPSTIRRYKTNPNCSPVAKHEYYNTYITFKFPVNLTENQLKTRETELKKQLKAIQIQLKKYK